MLHHLQDVHLRKWREMILVKQLNSISYFYHSSQPPSSQWTCLLARFISVHIKRLCRLSLQAYFPPNLHHKLSFPSSIPFSSRNYNLATLRIRADMEAIQDPHARIRSRGCQLDPSALSKEDGNEQTQFNHDKVDGDASPCTGGEGLEFILDQRLTLRRREPASVIKSGPHDTSVRIQTLRDLEV